MLKHAVLVSSLVALSVGAAPVAPSSATSSPAGLARLSFGSHDLGDLGMARAVNDRGVVVGVRQFEVGFDRAFRRDPRTGLLRDLGTIGGPTSEAWDVDAAGRVAGSADTPAYNRHAVRWNVAGRPTDLGTLGGPTSYAVAIDDAGRVAGWSRTSSDQEHAFRWDPRTRRMTDLGTLGGAWSQAWGFDDRGGVVGAAATAQEVGHAFRWDPRTRRMTDLGTLPGYAVSSAAAANGRGLVVGTSADIGDFTVRAVLWSVRTGTVREIPALGGGFGEAVGVDAHGLVVGTHWLPESRAFAWDATTGAAAPLRVPGDTGTTATAVSDSGLILGRANLPSGTHSVIWKARRR